MIAAMGRPAIPNGDVRAPVASRIKTYALPIAEVALAYANRLLAAPGPAAWVEAALGEHEFIAEDEPYRQDPNTR